MNITITHIGTATMLLEIGELRLLTDPVFDPPGGHYNFGWGTGSTKLTGPALAADQIGRIDAVLLSHDHHDDNLDRTGRTLLPQAKRVLTTTAGAKRLGGNAEGLAPWQSTPLELGATKLRVTATPAQHGSWITKPLIGQTIGFVLQWEGQQNGVLYISGDTIYYKEIDEIAERFQIGTAILHVGDVRFPITGPLHYTMSSSDTIKTARVLQPRTIIPIHYEGWGHFQEGRPALEHAFHEAELTSKVAWLPLGQATDISL